MDRGYQARSQGFPPLAPSRPHRRRYGQVHFGPARTLPPIEPRKVNFPLCWQLDVPFHVGAARVGGRPTHQSTHARPEDEMVNRNVRETLEKDANRDMSHVPGTYNPGNQAGKEVHGGGKRRAGEPGRSFLGMGEGSKKPKVNPQQTGTPGLERPASRSAKSKALNARNRRPPP
jgi:hypothetical protein